jgi:hypothetical protein
MTNPYDDVILAAENAHILFSRMLSEKKQVTPENMADVLFHLNAVLDAFADVTFAYGDDDVEVYDDVDWGTNGPPEDQLETDYEIPSD